VVELVHLLGLVGAAIIVARGSIFKFARQRVPPLACAQCVGFWVGFWPAAVAGVVAGGWGTAGVLLWRSALCGGAVSLCASLAEAALAALDEIVLKLQRGELADTAVKRLEDEAHRRGYLLGQADAESHRETAS